MAGTTASVFVGAQELVPAQHHASPAKVVRGELRRLYVQSTQSQFPAAEHRDLSPRRLSMVLLKCGGRRRADPEQEAAHRRKCGAGPATAALASSVSAGMRVMCPRLLLIEQSCCHGTDPAGPG